MTAVLEKDGVVLIDSVRVATGFGIRFLGLMGRSGLAHGKALYFPGCGCVHTCFVRFRLDLIFLDRQMRVIRIARNIRPWRLAVGCRGAKGVVETASGWLPRDSLAEGDTVSIRERTAPHGR
jgi:uncharacterized membrane protein (UPF0127 family)